MPLRPSPLCLSRNQVKLHQILQFYKNDQKSRVLCEFFYFYILAAISKNHQVGQTKHIFESVLLKGSLQPWPTSLWLYSEGVLNHILQRQNILTRKAQMERLLRVKSLLSDITCLQEDWLTEI